MTGHDTVGVCGSGVMGQGIAAMFAASGYDVLLYDTDSGAVGRAVARIGADIDARVEAGRISGDEARTQKAHLLPVADLSQFARARLVVETVTEDVEIKRQVFRSVEAVCAADTIIATNTSTLSPTEIAAVLADPARACGVHFFNPAQRMKLVELMPGLLTSDAVAATLTDILTSAGKRVIRVRESPGGIVSRMQLLLRNEALRMLGEGVASAEDIDEAMRLGCGWPLGPFQLIDLVGVDVHLGNSESLTRELGSNRYAPHPYARTLVRGGQLGRKSGRGIYEYPDA